MIGEPMDVFFETGVEATLLKSDGSHPSPLVRGLLEDGATDRATGETTRAVDEKNFTCPSSPVATYSEGDKIIIGGVTRRILDALRDDIQTSFLLSHPIPS